MLNEATFWGKSNRAPKVLFWGPNLENKKSTLEKLESTFTLVIL